MATVYSLAASTSAGIVLQVLHKICMLLKYFIIDKGRGVSKQEDLGSPCFVAVLHRKHKVIDFTLSDIEAVICDQWIWHSSHETYTTNCQQSSSGERNSIQRG